MVTGTNDMSQENKRKSQVSILLSADMERETHHKRRCCYCQVGSPNISTCVENSVSSRVGRNYTCHCQLNTGTEKHEKISVDEHSNLKSETISSFVKTGEKYKCLKKFRKLKRFHIFLLISFASNIGLITTALCLGIRRGKNTPHEVDHCPLQQLPSEALQDVVCIPSDYLESTLKAEDTLFNIILSCGYRLSCVKNAEFQKFLLLVFQERNTNEAKSKLVHLDKSADETLKMWRSRDIAAHLYLDVTSLPERLTWRADVGFGTALLSGITLTEESRLMVPRAGYYFIYSAVTFRCQDSLTTRLHLINKQHKGRPIAGVQQLLLSKSSECGPTGYYTSFLGGVLELRRNDEISVSVADDSLERIYTSSLSSFFGVYVI